MILSPTMQQFLSSLISRFEEEKLSPVILRNYEKLPIEVGNDLDIFVCPESIRNAEALFNEILEFHGGSLLHRHKRGYFVALWSRFPDSDDWLHIDLYHGALRWHGFEFLSTSALTKGSRRWNDYPVPRPAHEALTLLLASLLWGGFVKERYRAAIQKHIATDVESAKLLSCLGNAFGTKGCLLYDFLTKQTTHDKMPSAAQLRRALVFRQVSISPLISFVRWAHHWFWEIKNYLVPCGMTVYLPAKELQDISGDLEAALGPVCALFGNVKVVKDSKYSALKSRWYAGRNYLVLRPSNKWSVNGNIINQSSEEGDLKHFTKSIVVFLSERIQNQSKS